MEIYKSYKFRLYPTKEQREYFNRCIGCARFIYNWALEMKQEAYDKDGTSLSIMNEKTQTVGVNSTVVEPETQVSFVVTTVRNRIL